MKRPARDHKRSAGAGETTAPKDAQTEFKACVTLS